MRRPSLASTLLATAIAAASFSPLAALAATTTGTSMSVKMAPMPHHKRHIVHVTGRIVSINTATNRITLSNHKSYHFKNVAKYKVGQKLTISYWI